MSWLASVGSSLVGGVIDSVFGRNDAEIAWEHQKEMAQHKYQWAVEDLRKAGLNPILAATNGMTASSPSVPVGDSHTGISRGVQNAISALNLQAMESQIHKNRAEAKQAEANATNNLAQAEFTNGAKTAQTEKQIEQMSSEIEYNKAQIFGIMQDVDYKKALTVNEIKRLEILGQDLVNKVQEYQNLRKAGMLTDASIFATRAVGSHSLASASAAVETARLISRQRTGQEITNEEKRFLLDLEKSFPKLSYLTNHIHSVGGIAAGLAGFAGDIQDRIVSYWKEVRK